MHSVLRRQSLRLFAFFLAGSTPLPGQEPDSTDSSPIVELSEIVVTASRGIGDLLRLPMAVGIIGPEELVSARRGGLADVLNSVPGILVQSRAGSGDVRMTIRGFGARGNGERSNAATIRGIKVLIDGVPETDPDGRTSLDLVDPGAIKRIEVVRTNASTLFGNASGGIVNIETFGNPTAPAVTSANMFGSFGLRRNTLAAESPLGTGSFSVSLSNASFGGWRQNSEAAATQFHLGMRSSLNPSTRLKVLLSGGSNMFSIPGPLTDAQYQVSPTTANSTYLARRERRANKLMRLAGELSLDVTSTSSLNILAYATPKELRRSERNTYREFYRLHSGVGAVYVITPHHDVLRRISAGFDASYQDGAIHFYDLVNGEQGTTLRSNQKEAALTFGAFLEGEINLMPLLSLIVGGRLDRHEYVTRELPSTLSTGTSQEQLRLNHLTPRASLLFRATDRHSVYATVSGGVEAPAFNEVDPPPTLPNASLNPLLKPMTSTTVEVGAKGFLAEDQLFPITSASYSLAVYRISIRDEIVPYNGGTWYFSAGSSERFGAEAGMTVGLPGEFSTTLAVTALRSRYQNYENDLGTYAGRTVPGIAPLTANIRITYAAPFGVRATVGANHIARTAVDDANTLHLPSSTIWSAGLSTVQSWNVFHVNTSIGVNNLADKKSIASAYINPAAGANPAYLEPGLPRNFFASLDLRLLY